MLEFARSALLLGEEAIQSLRNCTVMVFGVGGVGSHCIEALARGGVGRLILVDNDVVSESNINRQSIAFHSTLGQYKTRIMKDRIRDICPETRVITHETFVLEDNLAELVPKDVDYIVDAIDTVTAKLALASLCSRRQIPLISCMGTGNKLNPSLFEIADIYSTSVCPLCKVMRKECRARGIEHLKVLYSKEPPLTPHKSEEETAKRQIPGSVSFVPPVAGLLIAREVILSLIKN